MEFYTDRSGDILTFYLKGRLDTATAPKLDEAVSAMEGVSKLILDLTELDYISSAGLRVIMRAIKIVGVGNVSVRGAGEMIREVFDLTGFADLLEIL